MQKIKITNLSIPECEIHILSNSGLRSSVSILVKDRSCNFSGYHNNLPHLILKLLNFELCLESFITFFTNYEKYSDELYKLIFGRKPDNIYITKIIITLIKSMYIIVDDDENQTLFYIEQNVNKWSCFNVIIVDNTNTPEEQYDSIDTSLLNDPCLYSDTINYMHDIKDYLFDMGPKFACKTE